MDKRRTAVRVLLVILLVAVGSLVTEVISGNYTFISLASAVIVQLLLALFILVKLRGK